MEEKTVHKASSAPSVEAVAYSRQGIYLRLLRIRRLLLCTSFAAFRRRGAYLGFNDLVI